jgi:hypothetical protein
MSTVKHLWCRKAFLSNTNSILTGKQCARCSWYSNKWVSFERYMCFVNSADRLIWKKMSISPPWNVWFAWSIPFTNYLNSHWDIMGRCLSWIGHFGTNRAYSHLEKQREPLWTDIFLSKLTQFSLWDNVIDTAASTTGGSLWRDPCVSSTQWKRPIWRQ